MFSTWAFIGHPCSQLDIEVLAGYWSSMLINHCAWQNYTATYTLQNPSFTSFCWPVEEAKTGRQNIQHFNKKRDLTDKKERKKEQWNTSLWSHYGDITSGIILLPFVFVSFPWLLGHCTKPTFLGRKTHKCSFWVFFSYHPTHTLYHP